LTVPLKIRVRKKLPSHRVSVSLPGEQYAKLELYQRLLGEGVGANDVIAEALRVCFESDKDFRRAWEEECAVCAPLAHQGKRRVLHLPWGRPCREVSACRLPTPTRKDWCDEFRFQPESNPCVRIALWAPRSFSKTWESY
jgi:hypothetical protein